MTATIPSELVSRAIDNLSGRLKTMPMGRQLNEMVETEVRRLMRQEHPGVNVTDKDIYRAVYTMYAEREQMVAEVNGTVKSVTEPSTGVVDTAIAQDLTIRQIQGISFAVQNEATKVGRRGNPWLAAAVKLNVTEEMAIAAFHVWQQMKPFIFTKDKGELLTARQVYDIFNLESKTFLQIHAINYAAYYACMELYDWLCDKKYIGRFSKAEGYWRKTDKVFADYQKTHRSGMERSAWSLFQDHMLLSFDNVKGLLHSMETAIRDFLIQHRQEFVGAGQKDDITLLSKSAVALAMLTCMARAFREFFQQTLDEHGVDLSGAFLYASLNKMTRNVCFMLEALGIRFTTAADGTMDLLGIDFNRSPRITSIWKTILFAFEDADVADDTAQRALSLNPEADREYHDVFAESDAEREAQKKADMEAAYKELEEKYKVTRKAS